MLIHQMIEYNAQNYPTQNALRFGGKAITYGQFNARATAFATSAYGVELHTQRQQE